MADAGKAFDLMNPPKNISGGATGFQEYPKHLRNPDGSVYVAVSAVDEAQHSASLKAAAPVEDVTAKRGPGRPRTDDRG